MGNDHDFARNRVILQNRWFPLRVIHIGKEVVYLKHVLAKTRIEARFFKQLRKQFNSLAVIGGNNQLRSKDQYSNPQVKIKSELLYMLLLSLCSVFSFVLKKGWRTAFEWTTVQDIPLILRLMDPDFLTNDFYTNSLTGSPRFLFSYIFYGFTKLGIKWYLLLYGFKFLYHSISSPLLFLMMYTIVAKWKPDHVSKVHASVINFILFLGALGLLSSIQGYFGAPFGWGPIQSYSFLSPMTLSYFFGLLYNISSFSDFKFKYLSSFILAFSVLLHPVIGLFHFVISLIFLLPIAFHRGTVIRLLADFLLGILAPFLFFMNAFPDNVSISASSFIHHYVVIRHPHHYLMSEVVSSRSVKWVVLFLIPFLLSLTSKNKKLICLSFFIFASFLLFPFIQFLGTEVWEIKKIAVLGPSRFSTYTSILWGLNMIIVCSTVCQNQIINNKYRFLHVRKIMSGSLVKNISVSINAILSIFKDFLERQLKFPLLLVLYFVVIFFFTYRHPLQYYDKGSSVVLIEWVSKNTPKNSTFFVRGIDSFIVRVFGRRAIFSDTAFPFDESSITDFTERFLILRNSHIFNSFDYACLNRSYAVDYLILPLKEKLEDYQPVFSSEKWLVYDLSAFKIKKSCEKNGFKYG